MQEVWKAIPGFEGLYEASSLGRIRSLDRLVVRVDGRTRRQCGRVLKQTPMSGYLMVSLSVSAVRTVDLVHRLVASAFCEKPDGCEVINHLDADKSNNVPTNLEWTTSKKNTAHAVGLGLMNTPLGSRKGLAKLTELDVEQIIRRLYAKEMQKDIANDYGVAHPIIANINLGKAWRHVVVPECGSPPYHLRHPPRHTSPQE